jgi:nodulation protein E
MSPRRVVVTGAGAISALGANLDATWQALTEARSGIAPIEGIAGERRSPNGAQVRGFDPRDHFDDKSLLVLDRFAQFALVAAREAVTRAGIVWSPALRERTAVVTGTSLGGQTTEEDGYFDLFGRQRPRVNPLTIPRGMANAAASQISMVYGLTGPAYTVCTACASSNHAIGQAFWLVRSGVADVAVTGGSEAPFTFGVLKAWEAMRVLSPDTCRPFSRDRRGLILGEGAAMLVLETLEAAVARGAPILGEIAGFGMSADAHHLTDPLADGAAAAMRRALDDAGIQADRVGYINAHGTGTRANDPMETAAIRQVFGPHVARLAVSSTKSLHGHLLGATGALEAVATLLALERGVLPPTANFTGADPECDLDVVPNVARPAQIEVALSNAFAFGGLNAVLVFRHGKR